MTPILLRCLSAAAGPDEAWPQWRGPFQNGTAPHADPPVTWSETNNIKWKVQIPGDGTGTPVVWQDKIFVQTAVPIGKRSNPDRKDDRVATKKAVKNFGLVPPLGERPPGWPPRDGQLDHGGFNPPKEFGPFGPGLGTPSPSRIFGDRMIAEGDQDADGRLSRDELMRLAQQWFDKIDTQKTGKLDQENFVVGFERINAPPNPPPDGIAPLRGLARHFFKIAVADREGVLTRDAFGTSFQTWFVKWNGGGDSGSLDITKLEQALAPIMPFPELGGRRPPNGALAPRPRNDSRSELPPGERPPTWPPRDRQPDGDGFRLPNEFGPFEPGLGTPSPSHIFGDRMIAEGDQDADGMLSRDELIGLAQRWFDKIDTEKTGKLDQEKFVVGFERVNGPPNPPPDGTGPLRGLARHFFKIAVARGETVLTRDAFGASFQTWFAKWNGGGDSGSLDITKLEQALAPLMPLPEFGGGGPLGGTWPPGVENNAGAESVASESGFGGGQKSTEVHRFTIMALDRETGKVLWQQVAREEVPHETFREGEGSLAANSGVTDGEHAFAYFGSRGLYCYDFAGTLKWSHDLGKMRVKNQFGEGSSPALYKDTLVITWDNEDGSFITAFDKNSGKQLWKQTRDEWTSWATPLIVEHDGVPQIITDASHRIRCYDLATGKLLWDCSGLTANVIPSPVSDGNTVYCTSGYGGNALLAIKLGRCGELSGSDAIAWTHKKSTPYVPSPLLYQDRLYFCAYNSAIISCLDSKSGKPIFAGERLEGLNGVYASPVGAAGRIYIASRNGATVVLSAGDKFESLAMNKLNDRFDASPVAVGKELLLRGRKYLYCIKGG
jgi:outer membrane protein assembly factor BamB